MIDRPRHLVCEAAWRNPAPVPDRLAQPDDHDLVKPRMRILVGVLPPGNAHDAIARALAIGCPDAYCGRFRDCGLCWIANVHGVFEELRDVRPDGMED